MIRPGFQPSQRPPAQRRCSGLGFQGSVQWRRAGNGQVGPARVTQPCPCLALGTGERPFSTALPRIYGIAQVLGPPAAPLCLCCHGIPAVWRLAGNRIISKPFPAHGSSSAFAKTSQQDHIPTISAPAQSLSIPHTRPSRDRVTPALPEQAAAKPLRKAHFRSN